jgi:hypothetical protein
VGSASVLASIAAVSPYIYLILASACASATLFMGEERLESIVSKMSKTFTILFLLGVIAELFSAFSIVTSAEGFRISGIFVVPSVFDLSVSPSSTLVSISLVEGAFGVVAGSSAFYIGGVGSVGAAVEEVSPPNSDIVAGSI